MRRLRTIVAASLFSLILAAYALLSGDGIAKPGGTGKTFPAPEASASAIPSQTIGAGMSLVVSVVDGDTIKVEGGEIVRYIGMDTPETVAPGRPVDCFGKEASKRNDELTRAKAVRLEADVRNRDQYGRLLRYVWVGDTMINEQLVREGYARVSTYPPDVKYADRLVSAERQARENNAGLWGAGCAAPTPTPEPTGTPVASASATIPTPTFVCDCTKECGRMSCSEAEYMLKTCGCTNRDTDGDGIACKSDCL